MNKARELGAAQEAEFAALVEAGPGLARDGVARWWLVDLCGVISTRYGVSHHLATVSRLLQRLGLRRLSVRPHHPKHGIAEQSAQKKRTSRRWQRPRSGPALADGRSKSASRMRPGSVSKAP
ncbi:hypothetical protein GCM10011320_61140 [Neoroseomonas lacus]|uniref:Winged helix-turn helix domain-containing protein n=1 Tax=Neoroseomonas lacus TaxID=287609 RepID=A0A917L8C4_9PROT|nr:winged helix-turn-helix domain-containing protein [Neoroseomonas lacus]GGJ45517.1 hypothetical protein GCM10011320_61140 [Neoroseomonas lacus]